MIFGEGKIRVFFRMETGKLQIAVPVIEILLIIIMVRGKISFEVNTIFFQKAVFFFCPFPVVRIHIGADAFVYYGVFFWKVIIVFIIPEVMSQDTMINRKSQDGAVRIQ